MAFGTVLVRWCFSGISCVRENYRKGSFLIRERQSCCRAAALIEIISLDQILRQSAQSHVPLALHESAFLPPPYDQTARLGFVSSSGLPYQDLVSWLGARRYKRRAWICTDYKNQSLLSSLE